MSATPVGQNSNVSAAQAAEQKVVTEAQAATQALVAKLKTQQPTPELKAMVERFVSTLQSTKGADDPTGAGAAVVIAGLQKFLAEGFAAGAGASQAPPRTLADAVGKFAANLPAGGGGETPEQRDQRVAREAVEAYRKANPTPYALQQPPPQPVQYVAQPVQYVAQPVQYVVQQPVYAQPTGAAFAAGALLGVAAVALGGRFGRPPPVYFGMGGGPRHFGPMVHTNGGPYALVTRPGIPPYVVANRGGPGGRWCLS